MGVRDLGATVQRLSPGSVTPLPSLAALRGRRLAIDASLLTTKFHFTTPDPESGPYSHPHRHARAWYAFLTALRRYAIRPVVVFDGPTRVRAKARETARRRALRDLERRRAAAEGLRGDRLRQLRAVWAQLDPDHRPAVADAFRRAVQQPHTGPTSVDAVSDADGPASEQPPALPGPNPVAATAAETALAPPVGTLARLYADYRADATNPVYSKNQALVSAHEGAFFQSLLQPADEIAAEDQDLLDDGLDAPNLALPDGELDNVIARSDQLGRSHTKRSDAVPPSAFQEVRRLVQALGIPFLEPGPDDPHEAEGICSALYAYGWVDLVVSEDTDVAVYGAPLLRRITTTTTTTTTGTTGTAPARTPMNVLDPTRLREDLGLTRDQFVDFALLCGTDFTERIPGVGPVKALALIRQYSTIEAALSALLSATTTTHSNGGNRVEVPGGDVEAYLETVRVARAIFSSVPRLPLPVLRRKGPGPVSPSSSSSSTWPRPDPTDPALSLDSPDVSSLDPTLPSSLSSTLVSSSSLIGSLLPSPPSPDLPDLLRSLGILSDPYSTHPFSRPRRARYNDASSLLGTATTTGTTSTRSGLQEADDDDGVADPEPEPEEGEIRRSTIDVGDVDDDVVDELDIRFGGADRVELDGEGEQQEVPDDPTATAISLREELTVAPLSSEEEEEGNNASQALAVAAYAAAYDNLLAAEFEARFLL